MCVQVNVCGGMWVHVEVRIITVVIPWALYTWSWDRTMAKNSLGRLGSLSTKAQGSASLCFFNADICHLLLSYMVLKFELWFPCLQGKTFPIKLLYQPGDCLIHENSAFEINTHYKKYLKTYRWGIQNLYSLSDLEQGTLLYHLEFLYL